MARVSEKVGGIPETLAPGVDSRRAEEGWPAFQVVRDADIQIQAAEKTHYVDLESLVRTAQRAWFPVGPGTKSVAGENPGCFLRLQASLRRSFTTCGHNLLGSGHPGENLPSRFGTD